jgi:hypothetical protein
MKRAPFLLVLIVFGALPLFAQSNELGAIVGGSRRFVDGAAREDGVDFIESNFTFSNDSVDLFWNVQLDEELYLKVSGGRINTPVSFAYELPDDNTVYRRDADGELQHVEVSAEYRFPEIFGSSSIFGGFGLYRQTASNFDAKTDYGFIAGVNTAFPMTRRYAIVLEGKYQWVRTDFQPRFLTLGAGLKISF